MSTVPTPPVPKVLPGHHNNANALCILTWFLYGLSTAVLAARVYSKAYKFKRLALDDIFMWLAWACLTVYAVSIQMAYHYGLGRHYEWLDEVSVVKLFKWVYVAQAMALLGPSLGRAAVCAYLLAIIGRSKHFVRLPLCWFGLSQFLFTAALLATLYSVCGNDIAKMLNPATTCYVPSPWSRFTQFVGSYLIFTDAFLTLAPTLMVLKLRVRRSTKCAAIFLLSLSGLAMVAAIWRTAEVKVLFSNGNWDFTYDCVPYFQAAALEGGIILITGSIPALGPLFHRAPSKTSMIYLNQSSRKSSMDSTDLQHNLAHALGMNMPRLGNVVVISAGPMGRRHSEESDITPLAPLPPTVIAASKHTHVKVEYANAPGVDQARSPVRDSFRS